MEAFLVNPGPASGPPPAAPEPASAATDWSGDLTSSDPRISDETRVDNADYMHARFYNPGVGRFLSVDRASGSPGNPQSWNRYVYVGNNPLSYVDPDGHLRVRAYPSRLGPAYTLDFETSRFMIRAEHYIASIPNRLLPGGIRRVKSPLDATQSVDQLIKGPAIETHSTLEGKLDHASFEASVRDKFLGEGTALGNELRESEFFTPRQLDRLQGAVLSAANALYNDGRISLNERNRLVATYNVKRLMKEADDARAKQLEELKRKAQRE